MCGIFGVIGKKAIEKTMTGIEKLEYRGYDSAGIAFIKNEENSEKYNENQSKNIKNYTKNIKNINKNLICLRQKGEIKELKKIVNNQNLKSEIALAHTRWATHGEASIKNSHPHLSHDGRWAIVHNGIIENYMQLKTEIDKDWFCSDTDSEVVAHLLEKYFNGNPLETFALVCRKLKGSFALAVVYEGEKECIFVARQNSPAVVGCNGEMAVVSSDISAVEGVNEVYFLENENIALVRKNELSFFDFNLNKMSLNSVKVDEESLSTEKGDFPHFMLKEIEEVGQVIQKTAFQYKDFTNLSTILPSQEFAKFKHFLIIGCGTAYHAGLVGADTIEKTCKIKCTCLLASELCCKEFLYDKDTLAIFISQSGETADTLKAAAYCKDNGLKTLAICNVKNSSITRACDYVLYTLAGREFAVASTKAYNAQLVVFYLFAAYLQAIKGHEKMLKECYANLVGIAKIIESQQVDKAAREIANNIKNCQSLYMIGRGMDYNLALESSLKLKEISYIHSEAYPAGELKHGTLSLIDRQSFVFAFACCKNTLTKTLGNVKEVAARGGKVILITPYKVEEEVFRLLQIEEVEELFVPLYASVLMQKIAYFTACELGRNPDKPRGLAKSVTVE